MHCRKCLPDQATLRDHDQRLSEIIFTSASNPAQTGGLFASTQQAKPSNSGIFGSSLNTSQPQQNNALLGAPASSLSGGLFSQGANNQQQAAGSLFGGPSTQPAGSIFSSQSNQPQRTSLFGANAGQQTQHQSTGGGLFGSSITQQTQPQQGGGFSSFLGQNQTQGQPQQPHGGLLGGALDPNRAPSILSVTPTQTCVNILPMSSRLILPQVNTPPVSIQRQPQPNSPRRYSIRASANTANSIRPYQAFVSVLMSFARLHCSMIYMRSSRSQSRRLITSSLAK